MAMTLKIFADVHAAAVWARVESDNGRATSLYGPEFVEMYNAKTGTDVEIGLPAGKVFVVVSSDEAPEKP